MPGATRSGGRPCTVTVWTAFVWLTISRSNDLFAGTVATGGSKPSAPTVRLAWLPLPQPASVRVKKIPPITMYRCARTADKTGITSSSEVGHVPRAHPKAPPLRPSAQAALDPRAALPPRCHRRPAGRRGRARVRHGQPADGARLEGPPALVRPGLAGPALVPDREQRLEVVLGE